MQTLLPQLSYLPNISPKYPIHLSTSVLLDSLEVWFMAYIQTIVYGVAFRQLFSKEYLALDSFQY